MPQIGYPRGQGACFGEYSMAQHTQGEMNIRVQEKTFAGFVRFVTYAVVAIVVFLVFLALVNG